MTPVPADATAINAMVDFVSTARGNYPLLDIVAVVVITITIAVYAFQMLTRTVKTE